MKRGGISRGVPSTVRTHKRRISAQKQNTPKPRISLTGTRSGQDKSRGREGSGRSRPTTPAEPSSDNSH